MSPVTSLSRVLGARIRGLRRYLGGVLTGEDRSIHQARVASRRLREALPVVAYAVSGSGAGKARRKLRRLTRALRVVRELDVAVELLDEIGVQPGAPGVAVARVRTHLLAERAKQHDEMRGLLKALDVKKLERRLSFTERAVAEAWPLHDWRAALASRLTKRTRRLRDAIDEAGQMYAPETLHRVRIAVKQLRYALELAGDLTTAKVSSMLRVLRSTQDVLGRLHDLQVLQHHVGEVAAGPRRQPSDGGLEILARIIEDECRRLHGRYVAAIPRLAKIIASGRTGLVPALQVRRPLKMHLSRAPRVARSAR